MDSNEHNKVIAFDTLFCTNHIQMLKIILSYMDNQTQKAMAVYIKFLELNYTIDYFKKHPYPLYGCAPKEVSFDIFKMCSELLPFCTEGERRQLEQIKGIFQSMEMYKEMSKTMDMMKEFMPDMADFMGNSSMNNAFDSFFGGNSGNEQSDDENNDADNSGNRDMPPDNDPSAEHDNTSSQTGGFNMMNMLMNMLTPEQKQMYEMFGGNQHAE